jgi:hypothetical protein
MEKLIDTALETLRLAQPASGFRPETPEEWQKLHEAFEQLGYVIFRQTGLEHQDAKNLARKTYGGPGGLMILHLAFSGE